MVSVPELIVTESPRQKGTDISETRRTLEARILAPVDRLVPHREGTPLESGAR